ncbi:PfkB family carbohydrate kinase [Phenylobacterium sp.]|uniref:PfkB family carbohydrate kinase n=1 Tax=Phenylobacterium sp. TaxID=1871053 RepID=UPI002730593D|nr:PfkB family carbohydrate kinase [Phenylobacterium sp.]MDP1618587.1 PfkB family carbohydrate kinase [Phenylobacterium sp.]MDP1989152.1 PfkB family carbohydrate kinase [Phenylobacterium sp.]
MADFLVIGALALDRPVWLEGALERGGRVAGRSLEAQLGPRLGGGGANAGVALAKAGHRVTLASLVASDAGGDQSIAMAMAAGLDVALVGRRPGESRTTLILIEPDGERLVLGLDIDRARLVLPPLPSPQDHPEIQPGGVFVRAAFPGADAWAARSRGPVVVHWPAPNYAGPADVVVCSADDLDPAVLAAPFEAAQAVFGSRLSSIVVTHGAGGASAYSAGEPVTVRPPSADVVDSTGAGDVFAAGLLEALSAGAGMERALEQACAWGAVTVGLASSAPVDAGPGVYRPFAP